MTLNLKLSLFPGTIVLISGVTVNIRASLTTKSGLGPPSRILQRIEKPKHTLVFGPLRILPPPVMRGYHLDLTGSWNLGRLLRSISGLDWAGLGIAVIVRGVANEAGTNSKRSIGLGFDDWQ
ncbi:hypothetical protein TNCV_2462781 [Trichonephila clavipes]|nr:hypothetical protein TNCV_2462781 [Trichonephila clavipes]